LFRSTLAGLGAAVADISGSWEARKRAAVERVDLLLKGPNHE
jgi:hypothetical protein